jgi:hypothetical protein
MKKMIDELLAEITSNIIVLLLVIIARYIYEKLLKKDCEKKRLN